MIKSKYPLQRREIETSLGKVYIEGPVTGNYIKSLGFDHQLNNFRLPEKQQVAVAEIADAEDGMVYILRYKDIIIGYVTFHDPDPTSRWCKHPKVYELGAIEISPQFRNNKLSIKLLHTAFSNPVMEDKIVITTEYCWHWDLEKTGLDIWSYQRMLAKVFGSVGMTKVETDDPDICEHVANVLMVRYGKNISDDDKKEFKNLQFIGGGTLFSAPNN